MFLPHCLGVALCLLGALRAQCIDEGPEPNDFLGVPTPIRCGMRVDGALTAGDFDHYAITVTAPHHLKAYTSYGRGSTAVVDTVVEIHDALDAPLALNDDGGPSLWSYVGCNLVAPGVYYVVVRGFGAATAGAYTLDILCEPAPLPEAPEPNDDPLVGGVPSPGACGAMHKGEIAVAGDADWWAFAHPGGSVTITTGPSGLGVPPVSFDLEDSTVELFDALSAAVLGSFDDDGGEGFYSCSHVPALAPGLYFVKVAGFGTSVGHYTLRIGCGEPGCVVATAAPSAAAPPGCIGTLAVRANAAGTVKVGPRIGTTYSVDASGLPPLSPIFHILGLSLLAPPLPLAGFGGAPGCFLSVSPDSVGFAFTDAAGAAKCCLSIPNNPLFIGGVLHWQVGNLIPIGTTNVVTATIGNIAFP